MTVPRFEQCEECTHIFCGYLFVHYVEVGDVCIGDCMDADELEELYPDWIDVDGEYL